MTPDDFYSVDSPPIPTEIIRKMRPVRKKFPDMPRFIRSHTIGDVEEWKKAPTKTKGTIRLSPEIVEHFKSQGKGWQSRVNEALQEYVKTH